MTARRQGDIRGWAFSYTCLLIALLPTVVAAQGEKDAVAGVVQDQTGAVVPGVQITLSDEAGLVVATTQTTTAGLFTFEHVRPGSYELRATFPGFKDTSVRVRLMTGRPTPLQRLVLEIAAVTQEITVGRSSQTAANANSDAIVLDDTMLRDLPVFDRDVVAAAARFLDPAALGTGGVSMIVDGMEARKVGVSPSAIQQIKLNQDPYSAEFARPGRGRIEAITKAGSDAYHGSFNLTGRDAHLNARDPFAASDSPEQRRILEGVLSGPVAGGSHTSFLTTVERRARDINAPAPPLYLDRPDRAFGPIRQIESTARQETTTVQFTLRGKLAPRWQGSVQYALSFANNSSTGVNALPANNYDLGSEWGRADFDQRHKLDALATFKGGPWLNFGLGIALASGRPYSLRTGQDDLHTGQTNARPLGIRRNSLQGPGYASLDVRWSREIRFGSAPSDQPALMLGVDAFNVLNRVNFAEFVGNLSSPFFGHAIAALPPRRIQLSAGVSF